jgi:uncharacterized protein YndB with AHSA1/START domain
MADVIDLTLVVAEEPKRVFNAWMDPREHAQFTGGGLATIEPWSGGRFTAFDGDVHGIFLGVDAAARIVQTFRTPEFPPEARDSRVTVTFEPSAGGTRLHIVHSDVPPNLLRKLQKSWESNYLKPLARYFVDASRKKAAEKAAKAAAKTSAQAAPKPAPAKAAPRATAKARPAIAKAAPAPAKAGPTPAKARPAKAKAQRAPQPARAAPGAKKGAAKKASSKKTAAKPSRGGKGSRPKAVKSRGQRRSSRA